MQVLAIVCCGSQVSFLSGKLALLVPLCLEDNGNCQWVAMSSWWVVLSSLESRWVVGALWVWPELLPLQLCHWWCAYLWGDPCCHHLHTLALGPWGHKPVKSWKCTPSPVGVVSLYSWWVGDAFTREGFHRMNIQTKKTILSYAHILMKNHV